MINSDRLETVTSNLFGEKENTLSKRIRSYVDILEKCSKGCMDCSHCADVVCCDNTHPRKLEVLERAVLDLHHEIYEKNAKIERLEFLMKNQADVINRLQKDIREQIYCEPVKK